MSVASCYHRPTDTVGYYAPTARPQFIPHPMNSSHIIIPLVLPTQLTLSLPKERIVPAISDVFSDTNSQRSLAGQPPPPPVVGVARGWPARLFTTLNRFTSSYMTMVAIASLQVPKQNNLGLDPRRLFLIPKSSGCQPTWRPNSSRNQL